MIKLSLGASSNIEIPLVANNIPVDKMLVEKSDSLIILRVSSKGVNLFSGKFFGNIDPITVDIGKLKLKKENTGYKAFVRSSTLYNKLNREFNSDVQILSVTPDTIFFKLIDIEYKRVPVHLNLNYTLAKQHFLYDSLRLDPDSVTISGPHELLSSVLFVETDKVFFNDISDDQEIIIDINTKKLNPGLTILTDKVKLLVDVEEFTEGDITIPILIINNRDLNDLRIFPDKTKITYLVALKDYQRVEPSMFIANVDHEVALQTKSSRLKIQIARKPNFVKIKNIKPEKVEFILHK